LYRGRALILDEKLMQHGRDGIFQSVRILSGPPMADGRDSGDYLPSAFPKHEGHVVIVKVIVALSACSMRHAPLHIVCAFHPPRCD
jgi:hypothetical protein